MAKSQSLDDELVDTNPGVSLLFGEICAENVAPLIAWILAENFSESAPEQLTILINSEGGDLSDAFALIEVMRGSKIPINTVALGQVASAGLLIFMAGDYRIITPSCSVMSHHFSAGVSGTFHDLINANKEWNFTQQRIVNMYMECTGMSEEQIKEQLLPTRDVYLTPSEAVELKLADEVRGLGLAPQ